MDCMYFRHMHILFVDIFSPEEVGVLSPQNVLAYLCTILYASIMNTCLNIHSNSRMLIPSKLHKIFGRGKSHTECVSQPHWRLTLNLCFFVILIFLCIFPFYLVTGTSRRTKLFGTFPGNYVKPLYY